LSIKENLNKLMDLKGINAKALEKISGVPDSRISDIRNGKTQNPRMGTLSKLATALGVSTDVLVSENIEQYAGDLSRMKRVGEMEEEGSILKLKELPPSKQMLVDEILRMTDEEARDLVTDLLLKHRKADQRPA